MTAFELTDDEWALLANVPKADVVEFAIELDVLVPADPDNRELFLLTIPKVLDRVRADGLPFSKYDADDVGALSPELLATAAALQGTKATAAAVLRAGDKVRRTRERAVPGHDPYLYMLPMVLKPVLRLARAAGVGR